MNFDPHHAHLKSCVGSSLGLWLFVCLVIPSFHMDLYIFSIMFHNRLGFPKLVLSLAHCIYGRTQWGYTFFSVSIKMSTLLPITLFEMFSFLLPKCWVASFKTTCFPITFHLIIMLTSWYCVLHIWVHIIVSVVIVNFIWRNSVSWVIIF
jgi:hypothetical protein